MYFNLASCNVLNTDFGHGAAKMSEAKVGIKKIFVKLANPGYMSTDWTYTHSKKYSTSYYETLCKWGDFERAKTTLKMLLASWFLVCFFKRFRCLNAENLGSVGQRASKLLAVKLWKWLTATGNRTRAKSNHSQSLMASNFAALWPTDPKFSALKDLILFSTVSKVQEASSILKVGFAFSKWPHFHRAY